MKTNLRQVYPSILTWALVIGSLLWSSGADEVVPTDHLMVFYPFRAVLYLILSSGLLSFVGAALIRKVQHDMDGKELSYPRAYYAFFLICFTSSVLFAFIMEGEHINGFRPRLFWWLLLLLSALVPLFYSGVIAPTGSIRARSYAFYSFFSVMFGCLSSFGMILSDSYEGVKWLLGLIIFSVVVTAYGGQFLDFFKLKTLVRVRQRHKLLSSAKEPVMPASIAQVIDTSSPFYREIMREVAPVVIGRLLSTDSSVSPVELARKLITDAVLSRVEVGRGQDPMVIAHTVLIHEHDEIEKHAKRFAEAYAGGSIKSAISSVGDKNEEYGKKKSGPAEGASVVIPPLKIPTANQADPEQHRAAYPHVRRGEMNDKTDSPSEKEVSLTCGNCKHQFPQTDLQPLAAPASKDDIKPTCPQCEESFTVATREIGCPECLSSFWIAQQVMGKKLPCPHCGIEATLPSDDEWKELKKQASEFRWTVLSSTSKNLTTFKDQESIARGITNGQVGKDDECAVHTFAPTKKMRELCDQHFGLRKLYDPLGAWIQRVGNIVGGVLVILYLLTHIINGMIAMGGTYILAAVLGIFAILVTPTIIGLIIPYLIGQAFGVPLLGAYFGVVLTLAIGVGLFFLGRGIGRVATRIIGKLSNLDSKRVVMWE